MIRLPPGLIGRDFDLGTRHIEREDVRRYAEAIGDLDLVRSDCDQLTPGFALALRGGPVPAVELSDGTVSVHAGHTITMHAPLRLPNSVRIRSRITDVFEKNGRTGPLTVVARRAEIVDDADRCRVVVEDQQIVRWHGAATAAPSHPGTRLTEPETPAPASDLGSGDTPEVGTLVAAEYGSAPDPAAVDRYASQLSDREPLFVDSAYTRSLGYADVIVPGPLQSALLERMLRRQLPDWTLRCLSLSFRVSVIAGEPMTLAAIVVEHHLRAVGESLLCDVWLETGISERATIGTAALER